MMSLTCKYVCIQTKSSHIIHILKPFLLSNSQPSILHFLPPRPSLRQIKQTHAHVVVSGHHHARVTAHFLSPPPFRSLSDTLSPSSTQSRSPSSSPSTPSSAATPKRTLHPLFLFLSTPQCVAVF